MKIAPSILSANFAKIAEQLNQTQEQCQYIHYDVMDGVFVPNLTFGAKILKDLKKISSQVFDVHLMIVNPHSLIKDFIDAGADIITFHYEAYDNKEEILSTLKMIKSKKVKCGLSVKPGTDIKVLEEYLPLLDNVLVMSVEPGFGGQKFMKNSIDKIKWLSEQKENHDFTITVDGGINDETIHLIDAAGADIAVAGSYIFNSHSISEAIAKLRTKKEAN